ncbi:MAG: alpha/beta hydrolase [Lachnospiraceae bacterium]|nr:alpha/beta hydrolase [Lachnospiraceae bacterium]
MKKLDGIRCALKSETLRITDYDRKTHKGYYIILKDGSTRYQLSGEGNETIVLVHGFSSPYFIYDNLYGQLVSAGYRVLRYDLIGRGLSDRPKIKYDADTFVRQLNEITDKLLSGEKFTLIGTSMGGIIAARFAQMHPGKVCRLILLAPAVMDTFRAPASMKLCRIPVIGPVLFRMVAPFVIIPKSADELRLASEYEKDRYILRFTDFARYKGYMRALASSLADCILDYDTAMDAYRAVAASKIPMLVIWGTADGTMPYYQIERMKEVCPDADYVTYEGAYHMFVYDEADRTTHDILGWMGNSMC